MKEIKKYLAFILAACFVLTNVIPAFAEINQEPVEEQVIQIQENTVEEAIEVEKDTISEETADSEVIMMLNDAEEIQLDASNGAMLFYKIDKDNNILHISSVHKEEGYLGFDSYQIPPWQRSDIKSDINSVIIDAEIRPLSMEKWFSGFASLTSVTGSYIDTSNVTSMSGMFSGCSSLTMLDLGKFKTSNVTNMSGMLIGCSSLTMLDLSEFKTSNVTDMSGMFQDCSGLETIYVQSFNTERVIYSDDMFTGCTKLCGGNGTVYGSSKTDINYACIDKHGQSGYFTYGGSDRTTVSFVSDGRTVYTRTVLSGDSITVPAPVRNEYDGWFISTEKIYHSGDEFKTMAGESAYTLYAHLKKKKKSSGGGSSGSSLKPAFTGTWGNPVTGTWTQDANGEWHFRTNAPFISTWGYIVNPYAQAGQNRADWFWFDYNGCMLTGWRYINGCWYYLNPRKDGTFGACLIGPGRTPDGYEIDATGAWTGRKNEVN